MLATTAFHTICPFTFSLLCSSSCISFLVFLSSSPFLMVFLLSTYLLPSLSSLPLLLYHHHIFLHHVLPTFPPLLFSFTPSPFLSPPCSSSSSSSTPSPLPAPPPTSSLITSYKFLPLSSIFSTPSPPPHYVLPLLLVLIPLSFILLPPRSLLFFSLISPLSPFLTFLLVPFSSPSFISTPFCCLNLGLSIWSINLRNR